MPSPSRFKVLYVDDDNDACEMISLLLDKQYIEVTCAQSAAEATMKIKARRFDLVMLDVWLPQVDGFEFCRQLRASNSDMPVLFYSGAAYDADIRRGLEAGASAYLVKPNIDSLSQTVMGLLTNEGRSIGRYPEFELREDFGHDSRLLGAKRRREVGG